MLEMELLPEGEQLILRLRLVSRYIVHALPFDFISWYASFTMPSEQWDIIGLRINHSSLLILVILPYCSYIAICRLIYILSKNSAKLPRNGQVPALLRPPSSSPQTWPYHWTFTKVDLRVSFELSRPLSCQWDLGGIEKDGEYQNVIFKG